jgi:hypothetical protein
MGLWRALGAVLVMFMVWPVAPAPAAEASKAPRSRPVVIAIVGESGFNVLHSDFAAPSQGPPASVVGMPTHVSVALPRSGSFDARLHQAESGPLGHLKPGVLYTVSGTRVVGIISPRRDDASLNAEVDLFGDTDHGTGVASSAVGTRFGTAPNALLVMVLGATQEAWRWVAAQPWIDVVSTSYFGVGAVSDGSRIACVEGQALRQLAAEGKPVFSAAGNGDGLGEVAAPAGAPWVVHVGGVDASGRTWLPGQDSGDQGTTAITPNRPYDAGEQFSFAAASAFSLSGSAPFGGTSGAAPRMAGDAAMLIGAARRELGTSANGPRHSSLAWQGTLGARPTSGPLADGTFTSDELKQLLLHTATPALPASPARYLAEGYGAVTPKSLSFARAVLAGRATAPVRTPDDQAANVVAELRQATFSGARCG